MDMHNHAEEYSPDSIIDARESDNAGEENHTEENTIVENTMEENPGTNAPVQPEETGNGEDFPALKPKIKQEINMMLNHALHSGKKIPEGVMALLHSGHTAQLIKAHGFICDALAPATPETIMYTRKFYDKKKRFVLFSPIPLVRNFTVISIVAVLSLVISSLSSEVNTETLSKGVLNNHGFSLLINLLFLCSAALMGASFFLLSKLTKEVKEASLSADDATYYWTMLIMGILSGMILSEGVSVNTDAVSASVETNRLVFAILGGFSSEVVYKILQNIMQKIQSAISAI